MKSKFIYKDYLQLRKARHVLTAGQKDEGSHCFHKPLKTNKQSRNITANMIQKLLTRGDHQAGIFCSIIKTLVQKQGDQTEKYFNIL